MKIKITSIVFVLALALLASVPRAAETTQIILGREVVDPANLPSARGNAVAVIDLPANRTIQRIEFPTVTTHQNVWMAIIGPTGTTSLSGIGGTWPRTSIDMFNLPVGSGRRLLLGGLTSNHNTIVVVTTTGSFTQPVRWIVGGPYFGVTNGAITTVMGTAGPTNEIPWFDGHEILNPTLAVTTTTFTSSSGNVRQVSGTTLLPEAHGWAVGEVVTVTPNHPNYGPIQFRWGPQPEPLIALALWRNNIWEEVPLASLIGPVQTRTFNFPQDLEFSVHGMARIELRTRDNQILHNAVVPLDRIVKIPSTAIPSWYTFTDLRIMGFATVGQTVVNPAHVWQLPIMATIPLASGQIVSPTHGQSITVGPTQPIPVTITHGSTAGAEWKVRSWDISRQVARDHVLAASGTNRMTTNMIGLQSGRHAIALVATIAGAEQTVSRIEIDVIQQVAGQVPIEPIPSPIPPPPELGADATLIDRVAHGFAMVIYWITLPFIGIANMVTAITSALGNLVSNTGGFFSMFNMIWGFFPPEIRTGFAVMTPLLLVLWAVKR